MHTCLLVWTLHATCTQVFKLPLYGKMIAISLVAAPIILLGGAALMHVTGLSWGEALQQAYFVLNNVPGEHERRARPRHVQGLPHTPAMHACINVVPMPASGRQSFISLKCRAMRCGSWSDAAHGVMLNCDGALPAHACTLAGMDICSIDKEGAQAVLLIIHLASLFTFAGVVGLVTEDISNAVNEVSVGGWCRRGARHGLGDLHAMHQPGRGQEPAEMQAPSETADPACQARAGVWVRARTHGAPIDRACTAACVSWPHACRCALATLPSQRPATRWS